MADKIYSSLEPYPEVKVSAPNPRYAEMLLSDLSGIHSESSSVNQYMYNSFVLMKMESVAEVFLEVSKVESKHMSILGRLVFLLGGDPRLWEKAMIGMRYWTPAYLKYLRNPKTVLENAVNDEIGATAKYRSQLNVIDDPYVAENIARIIQDEIIHMELFKSMLNEEPYTNL